MPGPTDTAYTLQDVIRLTGAKRSQVENWVRSGWLLPEGRVSSGTGENRLYSFRNLVDVAIAVRLSRFRIALRALLRDMGAATLRGLIPDMSEFDQMSAKSIVEWHTKDWTDAEWDDALQPSDGLDRWTKEAYKADAVARYREGSKKWQELVDPGQRSGDTYHVIQIYYDASHGKYRVSWADEREARVYDCALVINLTKIFADLEGATGDHWRVEARHIVSY